MPEPSQQAETYPDNPWVIASAVMLATFMEVLDTSVAAVALPYIAGSLSASNDEATWVLTSYLVANAVILPTSNWFSLRFGRKRFLMICVALFTVSSVFCGAAPSLLFILLARIAQGAGGGALQPLAQAILLESFPPAKRSIAIAFYTLGVVVAPVLGPTLGGYLTDTFSWRYAFYINVPVGLLALFMIGRFVHDPDYIRQAKPGRFDNLGFGLLAIWTGCLQIVLDRGQEDDWFGAVWVRWAVFFCVASFLWFVVHCLRDKHPLVAAITPGVAMYNVGNLSNWTGAATNSSTLLNQANAGVGGAGSYTYVNGENPYLELKNQNRVQRQSGTFDQGDLRSTEFQLHLVF